ncbi:MAG: hypothetical protein ACTII7_09735, partial [Galactobacter sp.]
MTTQAEETQRSPLIWLIGGTLGVVVMGLVSALALPMFFVVLAGGKSDTEDGCAVPGSGTSQIEDASVQAPYTGEWINPTVGEE